ncbi:hypothetical protein HOI26_01660 [Candidatus Woesearchaeota archaeon]|jgi:hypothetical protein|nr:hypothetical protein [Candidatus Woesearchaeota archaeon]MBT5739782.1 hypothetical protein [Candidatus Woesearchaeota archaeon]
MTHTNEELGKKIKSPVVQAIVLHDQFRSFENDNWLESSTGGTYAQLPIAIWRVGQLRFAEDYFAGRLPDIKDPTLQSDTDDISTLARYLGIPQGSVKGLTVGGPRNRGYAGFPERQFPQETIDSALEYGDLYTSFSYSEDPDQRLAAGEALLALSQSLLETYVDYLVEDLVEVADNEDLGYAIDALESRFDKHIVDRSDNKLSEEAVSTLERYATSIIFNKQFSEGVKYDSQEAQDQAIETEGKSRALKSRDFANEQEFVDEYVLEHSLKRDKVFELYGEVIGTLKQTLKANE